MNKSTGNQKRPLTWFIATGIITTILSIAYVFMHTCMDTKGSMLVKLDAVGVNDLNRVIFNSDTLIEDSLNMDDLSKKELAFTFLELKFQMADSTEWEHTKEMLIKLPLKNFADYLVSNSFEVNSFFWLSSKSVYWEIIFWSWFGLLASLFYNVSEAIRLKNTDDKHKGFSLKELPVHIAKFFYTPFSAIIIFLSLDILTSSGEVGVSQYGYGSIVLSFILGFFSGRTIELLNRIKEVVLPGGKKEETETTPTEVVSTYQINGTLGLAEGTVLPEEQSLQNISIIIAGTKGQNRRNVTADESGIFVFDDLIPDTYTLTAGFDSTLKEVGGVTTVIVEDDGVTEKTVNLILQAAESVR